MFSPNCSYNKSTKSNNNKINNKKSDSPSKIQNQKDIHFSESQKSKNYTCGNLGFINVSAKMNTKFERPLFKFENSFYKSEEFAIQYYKSKGYNTFFSENYPWKAMLKTLFNDIFKEFKKISKQKGFKSGFYDNEFFILCEEEINDRFNYLNNINLIDEFKMHHRIKSKHKILKICKLLEDEQILSILYYILQDYHNRIRGFPDLFVYNDDEFFFCEVKANTDVLSAYQVRNHEQLIKTGIDVCVFSIHKSEDYIKEEKWKYFNDDFYNVDDFKEKYEFKIKTAHKIQNELEDNHIDKIKTKIISDYDLCTYMGFLNIMKDYSHDEKVKTLENIDKIIINKSKKEGVKIRNLHYLSKGLYYEERGLYHQAIEEYKNANDFYGYNQLCICYRKIKDYENEVNLTYNAINNILGIPADCKLHFKTRAQEFTKNKKSITVYKTNNKCPNCGGNEVVVVLKRKNNLKIKICDNGRCYWYGGLYTQDVGELERVTDLKKFNTDRNLSKSFSKFTNRRRQKKQESLFKKTKKSEENKDYTKNWKKKYELIIKGESLLNNNQYNESLEFYNELLYHDLFINDYYPFVMLVKSYKGLKQHKNEVEVIEQFFKSGRYCKQSVLKRFKKRLMELDELGYFDYSTIDELEEEFWNNGAKNLRLCRVPLSLAREMKFSKECLKKPPLKYSPDDFDSEVEFDNNLNNTEKINFKYKLILKGEKLYRSRQYDKAIAFYTRLLTHELFINDYYPYFKLTRILHKEKRYDKEVETITEFFKSGIYCDKNKLEWFKNRLRRLSRYGYYDYSEISLLEYEFDTNGALKEELSNQPVLSADEIRMINE